MFPDTELGFPAHRPRHAHVRGRRLIDINGNVDPTPASWTWTVVEGTAPDTTISGGPDDPTIEHERQLRLLLHRGGLDLRVLARRRRASRPAPRRAVHRPGVGVHQFSVVATDEDGTADPTPATLHLDDRPARHDGAGDDARCTAGRRRRNSTSADFTFSCRGRRDLRVRARRRPVRPVRVAAAATSASRTARTPSRCARPTPSGNVDETPAIVHTWTVDRDGARDVDRRGRRPSRRNSGTARLRRSRPRRGATFQCRLDAGALGRATSPKDLHGLLDGPHTFVGARSRRGRQRRPEPGQLHAGRSSTSRRRRPSRRPGRLDPLARARRFEFTSEPGVAYECSLDDAAYAACTSPAAYTGLAAGDHTFSVRSTDAAGNVDPTPAASAWTIDLAPDTTIDDGPADPTNSTSASLHFSSNEAGASFECSLDDSGFGSCALAGRVHRPRGGDARLPRPRDRRPRRRRARRPHLDDLAARPRRRSTSSSPQSRHRTSRPRARARRSRSRRTRPAPPSSARSTRPPRSRAPRR